MIDELERDRCIGADMIKSELSQFAKLQRLGLGNFEIAHRMALAPRDVHRIRRFFGSGPVKLAVLKFPSRDSYRIRILLGRAGIRTLNDLLNQHDSELLAIRGLGPKTLATIKTAICLYMETHHG
jgi:hypothetical protein